MPAQFTWLRKIAHAQKPRHGWCNVSMWRLAITVVHRGALCSHAALHNYLRVDGVVHNKLHK